MLDFNEQVLSVSLSAIKKMELEARKVPNFISLAQGIPDYQVDKRIKQFLAQRILKDPQIHRYSLVNGLLELRIKIADYLSTLEKIKVDAEKEIVVTAGAIEAVAAVLFSLINPGEEIIVLTPSYVAYSQLSRIIRAKIVYVSLDEDNGWQLDFDKLKKAISVKTKAMVFANPNNPTGTFLSKKDLNTLSFLALKHNFYLVADEVYRELILDEREFYSFASVPEIRDRLIRCFSFSKTFCLTGWRIGFVFGPARVIEQLLKVHDMLLTCAPVPSQYAALSALEDLSSIGELVIEMRKRRDLMLGELIKLKKIFSFQKPKATYYVFPKILVKYDTSEKFCLRLLKKTGVVTVPGSAFGPTGEGHIRLCFGVSREAIRKGMRRMRGYLISNF